MHLVAHTLDELEELLLRQGVQVRRRLVGDQQCRLGHESHREHDTLGDAGADLMGVVLDNRLGVLDTDAFQHLDGLLIRLLLANAAAQRDRLDQLPANLHHRMQRGVGVLEHHRDRIAALHCGPSRQR